MEQTEKILEKIKLIKSDKIEEEIQDIITIDGAIIEDKSYRYKEKIFYDLENKYKKYLKELKYSTFKYEVDDKVDKYVDSSMKEVNTQLGLLKLFLISNISNLVKVRCIFMRSVSCTNIIALSCNLSSATKLNS